MPFDSCSCCGGSFTAAQGTVQQGWGYGPSTTFLLHPLHFMLRLCRWQTPPHDFVWAEGIQRCLRCLTSSFSGQLSMPDTLLMSSVTSTPNCSPGRPEGKAQQVESDVPSHLNPSLRGQKISGTVQSQWVGSGSRNTKVLGLYVLHRALSAVIEP